MSPLWRPTGNNPGQGIVPLTRRPPLDSLVMRISPGAKRISPRT